METFVCNMDQQEYSDYVIAIYKCYYNPNKGIVEQTCFTFNYLLHRTPSFFRSNYEFNRNALFASLEELCYQKLMVKQQSDIGETYSITSGLVEIMRLNGYK